MTTPTRCDQCGYRYRPIRWYARLRCFLCQRCRKVLSKGDA